MRKLIDEAPRTGMLSQRLTAVRAVVAEPRPAMGPATGEAETEAGEAGCDGGLLWRPTEKQRCFASA